MTAGIESVKDKVTENTDISSDLEEKLDKLNSKITIVHSEEIQQKNVKIEDDDDVIELDDEVENEVEDEGEEGEDEEEADVEEVEEVEVEEVVVKVEKEEKGEEEL